MNRFKNVIILIVILLTSISCAQQDQSNSITMDQFKEQLKSDKNMILLDVRTPEELAGPLGKIETAINIPLQVLEQRISELEKFKDKEIIVICRTQNRSAVAVNILNKNGYKAKNVLGGMTEFRKN
ncbi:MAG TPA: rhodanese-like domain-containing protein [Ignavibacteriales bacterium]|nr:rhodanese-like domain-containing protein [Ignavibacteriales bacterium]